MNLINYPLEFQILKGKKNNQIGDARWIIWMTITQNPALPIYHIIVTIRIIIVSS